ncbi:MT-A70 protein [Acanthamoeba castellanii str. Neff]|uniref:MT-A70 protein n=1 Tax=Acanthamoeba castellanii (strain ATCC 30010 / Neff) TaxID=1257118 RepID=L8GSX9_ACACF|nr:MT-A70 protein [Acanthamoeba castellanii str. Neff]ELR15231.1 MT-A70 protein [Acanthamoeba castellanii str. Neff]
MKKFEALEQLEQGKRQKHQEEQEQAEAADSKGKGKAKDDDDEPAALALTEEELNELFKQTSTFTQQSALAKREQSLYGDEEESYMEFLDLEGEDGDDYYDEAGFWDDDDPGFGEPGRKRKRGGAGGGGGKAKAAARQARVPFESCEITGEDGFVYTIRKKVRYEDPNAPTYVRIPPQPITRSWCKTIAPFSKPTDDPIGSTYLEGDILKMELKNYGEFEAILMDPPWHTGAKDDPARLPGTVTPEELGKLKITDALLPKGLAFVWVEKELIPKVFALMKKWNFIYVENFAWVKKSVNNKFVSQPYKYFQKSKTTLFIFRKFTAEGKDQLELRHQRNPDVPDFTYHVIETLLPNAAYKEDAGRGKLLELWGRAGSQRRTGWTTIVQKP